MIKVIINKTFLKVFCTLNTIFINKMNILDMYITKMGMTLNCSGV